MRICSVQLGPLADYLKTVRTSLLVSPLFVCLLLWDMQCNLSNVQKVFLLNFK